MGYRDQNGTVHGPYALDRTKIHDKWLALQGEPGAPLGDDFTGSCVQSGTGILAILYIQVFERGYIQYCGSGAAEYVAYAKTYLPDTKIDYNGWNSSVTARSNVGGTEVSITFYKPDGKVVDSRAYYPYLATNAGWTFDASSFATDSTNPINNVAGAAVVAAGLDTSVVVENQYSTSRSYAYNGITASDPPNPDWGQVGTTLYAPVIMNDYYGWDSGIFLFNAGSATADVNVEYYGPNGTTPVDTDEFLLSPNERLGTTYDGGAEDTLYSARVVSDQPLAGVGFQYKWDGTVFLSYNCLSAGASTVYAPVIVNNYYGWDTSVNIQNTGDSSAWVYVRYYNTDGIQVGPLHVDSIPPYASRSRYSASPEEELPDNFIGTARIYSYQQPVAVVVNQSYPRGGSTTRGQSYNGTSSGSTYVVLPDVLNYYGSEHWVSSVNVRNLSTIYSTDVTLRYQGSSVTERINPRGFVSFYVPYYWGMDSLRGPATVSSDGRPVAVVVNHASVDQTWVDLTRSYNGCNR